MHAFHLHQTVLEVGQELKSGGENVKETFFYSNIGVSTLGLF